MRGASPLVVAGVVLGALGLVVAIVIMVLAMGSGATA